MQRSLVMTVIGQDRPGLVESVAGLVAEHGGNWLESRMSRLGGQFAGILRVEVPAEREAPLVAALKALAAQGLTVVVEPDQPSPCPESARLSTLEVGKNLSLAGLAYVLSVDSNDTKSGHAIEYPLAQALTHYVQRYLEHYRQLFR